VQPPMLDHDNFGDGERNHGTCDCVELPDRSCAADAAGQHQFGAGNYRGCCDCFMNQAHAIIAAAELVAARQPSLAQKLPSSKLTVLAFMLARRVTCFAAVQVKSDSNLTRASKPHPAMRSECLIVWRRDVAQTQR